MRLGLMGAPLVRHLAAAGHRLHLWARRAAALEAFVEVGAQSHASAAEVARHADVVIIMVANAPDVREVTLGTDGIAAGPRPGLIVVDMSTINPNAAREIGEASSTRASPPSAACSIAATASHSLAARLSCASMRKPAPLASR